MTRAAGVLVLAALAAGAACTKKSDAPPPTTTTGAGTNTAGGTAPAPAPTGGAAISVDSAAAATAALGKLVRISGTGDNAKLGAIVIVNDLTVYCTDRKDGWNERNVPVTVEGVLSQTDAMVAKPAPDGTQTAGTGGPIFQMTCALK